MQRPQTMLSIDLWEAWIEMLDPTDNCPGLLYVLGDVYVGNARVNPVLRKRTLQGDDPTHLYLEVWPHIVEDEGRVAEVSYCEPLENMNQYQLIKICQGSEVIAEIEEIEKVF